MSDPDGNYRADSNRDWRSGHEKEILQAAQQAHQAEEARPTFSTGSFFGSVASLAK